MENRCRKKVPQAANNHLGRPVESAVGRLVGREAMSRETSSTTLFTNHDSAMDRLWVRTQVTQSASAPPADIPHITGTSRVHAGRII